MKTPEPTRETKARGLRIEDRGWIRAIVHHPSSIIVFALASIFAPAIAPAQSLTPFFLQWDQPTNTFSPDGAWQIYATTNASTPLGTWPLLTNLYFTNMTAVTNATSATNASYQSYAIPIIPTNAFQTFYAIGYTNFSGVSPFSNVALRPALSQPQNNALHH
jgi:hypothetical protein